MKKKRENTQRIKKASVMGLALLVGSMGLLTKTVNAESRPYEEYYGVQKVETTLPNVRETKVCVIDKFENGTHGDWVVERVEKFFGGEIDKIDIDKEFNLTDYMYLSDEQRKRLSQCDVVNLSLWWEDSTKLTENEKMVIKSSIDSYLSRNDSILVTISGNSTQSSNGGVDNQSYLGVERTYEKDKYTDLHYNRTVLVGQLAYTHNSYTSPFALSDTIDYLVPNWGENGRDGRQYLGTSFAAPVVTGVIANLLQAGIEKDVVKDMLVAGDNYTKEEMTIGIIDINKTFKEANEFIDNKYASGKNIKITIR